MAAFSAEELSGLIRAWPQSIAEATAQQRQLRHAVVLRSEHGAIRSIGGTDMSNTRASPWIHAAAVRLDAMTLQVVESASATAIPPFPYVPGYLSFRESPVVLAALAKLATSPDLLVVDGHGYAHPRRLGIASHLGVLLDWPTVGCAKSILVGRHEPLGPEAGDRAPLIHRGELVGYALRTKRGVQPVFVSPGHRVGFDEAVAFVLAATRKYRLPEPTRLAHLAANAARRLAEAG